MNVLAITGSYRRGGNTEILVKQALEGVSEYGIDTRYIFLPDYTIDDCRGCEGCRKSYRCTVDDDMQKIYPLIESADAIITGSPTYFYNVTGIMKNFLDRLYCYEIFDFDDRSVWMALNEIYPVKYAVTVSVCEQENEEDMGYTSLSMSRALQAAGYRVVDNLKTLGAYAKGEILKNEKELNRAKACGEKLAKTLILNKTVKEKINKIH